MKKISLLLCLLAINIHCMDNLKQNQKTVFAFDLDGVISEKPDDENIIQKCRQVGRYASVFSWKDKARALKYIHRIPSIIKQAKEIKKTTSGRANITHQTMTYVKKTWGNDFTGYTEKLCELSLNPQPIPATIAVLSQLEKHGYDLMGATNQDDVHHDLYRKKLQKNINFDLFFKGIVTYASYKHAKYEGEVIEITKTWHSATQPKPKSVFYDTMKRVAQNINSSCDTIVFVDDNKDYIDGVVKAEKSTTVQNIKIVPLQFTSGTQLEKTLQEKKYLK